MHGICADSSAVVALRKTKYRVVNRKNEEADFCCAHYLVLGNIIVAAFCGTGEFVVSLIHLGRFWPRFWKILEAVTI